MVSTITDAGALSITTDNTAHTSAGNITRTATSTLARYERDADHGCGHDRHDTGANAINLASGQIGVTATTHSATGDVWLTDPGALTLGAVTTTGGDVDVRTTAAGTLTAGGTIGTGGGAVTLKSQDALAVKTSLRVRAR